MPGYIFKCLVWSLLAVIQPTSQANNFFIKGPQHIDIQKRWWAAAKVLKNTNYHHAFICEDHFDVWFKNRRAKWRKQKREEQERLRKVQEEDVCNRAATSDQTHLIASQNFTDDDSSDLEVA